MPPFVITNGPGLLVAAALHDGHAAHPETLRHFALDEAERRREEDPFTAELTDVAETRFIGKRTRFEVDLNRPPEHAVYRTPEDSWGLNVWRGTPPQSVYRRSMSIYEDFYASAEAVLQDKIDTHGAVVVYDIHSYNHRRGGPDGPAADLRENPEVNIGTGSLHRDRWGPFVDQFMALLREGARQAGLADLDVRENVKFQGGYFPRWVHKRFGDLACVLAIEFKKTFMDEWTGTLDEAHFARLHAALAHTVPGVYAALEYAVHGS